VPESKLLFTRYAVTMQIVNLASVQWRRLLPLCTSLGLLYEEVQQGAYLINGEALVIEGADVPKQEQEQRQRLILTVAPTLLATAAATSTSKEHIEQGAVVVLALEGMQVILIDATAGSTVAAKALLRWQRQPQSSVQKQRQPATPPAAESDDEEEESGRSLGIGASILHHGTYSKMRINSSNPVSFKNELFEGRALLMVRTDNTDSQRYGERFAGNHYTFEVQVQGRFLKVPPGKVFIGAEITKSMSLGLLTKSMCRAILQLGRTVNRHLHHSFGDDENHELPHIVGPMWSAADRLVVSPAGREPPVFGEAFPEEAVSRAARRKNADFTLPYDLDAVYSMSFKTSNIDLIKWTATNLPLVSNIDLHTFWSEADLRTVCYCVQDDEAAIYASASESTDHSASTPSRLSSSQRGSFNNPARATAFPKNHRQGNIRYLFSIQLEHDSNHPEAVFGRASNNSLVKSPLARRYSGLGGLQPFSPNDEDDDAVDDDGDDGEDNHGHDMARRGGRGGEDAEELTNFDEDSLFFDALDGNLASPPRDLNSASSADTGGARANPTPSHPPLPLTQVIPSLAAHTNDSTPMQQLHQQLQQQQSSISSGSRGQESCPYRVAAAIEVDEMRIVRQSMGQKGRRTLYAFSVGTLLENKAYSLTTGRNGGKGGHLQCVLRTYAEWTRVFPIFKRDKQCNNARLSDTEKRRLDLETSFKIAARESEGDARARAKLESFLVGGEHTTAFLTTTPGIGLGVSAKRLRTDLPPFRLESLVIVQLGNHFWSEEYMGLTSDEVVFIKPPNRLGITSRLVLRLESIVSVERVEDPELPFYIAGCSAMVISTFSRQLVVVMRGLSFRNAWVSTLDTLISTNRATYSSLPAPPAPHIDLLVRSKGWRLGERVILNARSFECASRATQRRSPDLELLASYMSTPHVLVARLLNIALALAEQSSSSEDSFFPGDEELQNSYVGFMDGVALLQRIDYSALVAGAGNAEKTCLFLNLFHLMLLHGFLVVGVPNSHFKWTSFYNTCAYEAFGDVFTLAELQKSVIHCGASPVSLSSSTSGGNGGAVGGGGGGGSVDGGGYAFALESSDPRLLWALNTGLVQSQPPQIHIYEPVSLSDQLDAAVRMSLGAGRQVSVSPPDYPGAPTVILLPKIIKRQIDWFDAPGLAQLPKTGPYVKVLSFLAHYVPDKHLAGLLEAAIELDQGSVQVKFQNAPDQGDDQRRRVLGKINNRLSISLPEGQLHYDGDDDT